MTEEDQASQIPAQPTRPKTILIAQKGHVVSEMPDGVVLVETTTAPNVQSVTVF